MQLWLIRLFLRHISFPLRLAAEISLRCDAAVTAAAAAAAAAASATSIVFLHLFLELEYFWQAAPDV
jgi:hypothetical protein